MYDAIFVPGSRESVGAMMQQGDAKHFIAEAFKHKKRIGALGEGVELLRRVGLSDLDLSDAERGLVSEHGVVAKIDNGALSFRVNWSSAD